MSKDFTHHPQFADCPVRNVLSRLCSKWSIIVILTLADADRPLRHSELARAIPDLSQKMLTATLHILVDDGIVRREQLPVKPAHVEYSLTARGRELAPLIAGLTDWAYANLHDILSDRAKVTTR